MREEKKIGPYRKLDSLVVLSPVDRVLGVVDGDDLGDLEVGLVLGRREALVADGHALRQGIRVAPPSEQISQLMLD